MRRLAEGLARAGVSPNAISVAGIGFALIAGLALLAGGGAGAAAARRARPGRRRGWWRRSACSSGCSPTCSTGWWRSRAGSARRRARSTTRCRTGSRTRRSSGASGSRRAGRSLGLWAALAAMACAYVRQVGGALGQPQCFLGPMAKQHRMAAVTLGCLLGFGEAVAGGGLGPARHPALGGPPRQPPDHRPAAPAHRARAAPRDPRAGPRRGDALPVGGRARWVGQRADQGPADLLRQPSSHLDTLVLWAALPPALRTAHPAGGRGGLLGRRAAPAASGAVDARGGVIRRGPGAEALAPLAAALADGGSLIVFPEGTRGAELMPAPFRSGLYHLAREFPGVELVPVYLDNLHRAWPKGTLVPVPVSTAVFFGAPVRVGTGEARARVPRPRPRRGLRARPAGASGGRRMPELLARPLVALFLGLFALLAVATVAGRLLAGAPAAADPSGRRRSRTSTSGSRAGGRSSRSSPSPSSPGRWRRSCSSRSSPSGACASSPR